MPLEFRLPSWSQARQGHRDELSRRSSSIDQLVVPSTASSTSSRSDHELLSPASLDKEADKAARILYSFCERGVDLRASKTKSRPSSINHCLRSTQCDEGKQNIPSSLVQKAKGFIIFTAVKTGSWADDSGGSGILIARRPEGSWSSIAALHVNSDAVFSLDAEQVYDCVLVLGSDHALNHCKNTHVVLNDALGMYPGPFTEAEVIDLDHVRLHDAPIWYYIRSRGEFLSDRPNGLILSYRREENEKYYGRPISIHEILSAPFTSTHTNIDILLASIQAAEGLFRANRPYLQALQMPTPGEIVDKQVALDGFGLPPAEDELDPFGVRALERQGMLIREAGTGYRPAGDVFEYKPSPTSPVYSNFQIRRSSRRDSGRLSIASSIADRSTQTADFDSPRTADSPTSLNHSIPRRVASEVEVMITTPEEDTSLPCVKEDEPATFSTGRLPRARAVAGFDTDVEDESDNESDASLEEATIIQQATVVTIPKRPTPSLPPRSPFRSSVNAATSSDPLPAASEDRYSQGSETERAGLCIDAPTASPPMTYLQKTDQSISQHLSDEEASSSQVNLPTSSSFLTPNYNKSQSDLGSCDESHYSRPTAPETPANELNMAQGASAAQTLPTEDLAEATQEARSEKETDADSNLQSAFEKPVVDKETEFHTSKIRGASPVQASRDIIVAPHESVAPEDPSPKNSAGEELDAVPPDPIANTDDQSHSKSKNPSDSVSDQEHEAEDAKSAEDFVSVSEISKDRSSVNSNHVVKSTNDDPGALHLASETHSTKPDHADSIADISPTNQDLKKVHEEEKDLDSNLAINEVVQRNKAQAEWTEAVLGIEEDIHGSRDRTDSIESAKLNINGPANHEHPAAPSSIASFDEDDFETHADETSSRSEVSTKEGNEAK